MLQDKSLYICGLFDVDRNDGDTRRPCGKIQHDSDVMIEENWCQTVPAAEPDLVMEEGGRPLHRRAELRISECPVELPVVIVVGQKRTIDQGPIGDAGIEKVGERTPGHRGRNVHLPHLHNILSYGATSIK